MKVGLKVMYDTVTGEMEIHPEDENIKISFQKDLFVGIESGPISSYSRLKKEHPMYSYYRNKENGVFVTTSIVDNEEQIGDCLLQICESYENAFEK